MASAGPLFMTMPFYKLATERDQDNRYNDGATSDTVSAKDFQVWLLAHVSCSWYVVLPCYDKNVRAKPTFCS